MRIPPESRIVSLMSNTENTAPLQITFRDKRAARRFQREMNARGYGGSVVMVDTIYSSESIDAACNVLSECMDPGEATSRFLE